MNPAFEISRNTANTMNRAFQARQDQSAIEQILSEAMQSGNPEMINNSIGKILSQVSPERQGPAIQYLQNTAANIKAKQEEQRQRTALEKQGLNPDLPKNILEAEYKSRQQENLLQKFGIGGSPKGVTPSAVSPEPVATPQGIEEPNTIPNPELPANPVEPLPSTPPIAKGLEQVTDEQLAVMAGIEGLADMAKAEQKRRVDAKKFQNEIDKQNKEEQRFYHKESESFYNKVLDDGENAEKQLIALNEAKNAIKSGNVVPNSVASWFKGFGAIGDKISDAFANKDQTTINTIVPYLLEGWKNVFGVRLSDADLRILQDKLPSITKSPEANLQVISILEKYGKMAKLRKTIAQNIVNENKGLRPINYRNAVDQQFQEAMKPIKIIRPKKNPNDPDRIIEVPAYEVGNAIQSGGRLVNERL